MNQSQPEPEYLDTEPCVETLLNLTETFTKLGKKLVSEHQYELALRSYAQAVQTVVTAHQLNMAVEARDAFLTMQAQQQAAADDVANQAANRRNFPFTEGEQESH